MIDRFREDANSTSIAYKKYGHTFDDKYPSFSICLEGDHLYRFNETSIFVAYGMLRSDYEMMLNGERAIQYHYDHSTRLYNKSFLPSKFKPPESFGIKTLFRIPGIIKKTHFVSENPSQSIFFGNKEAISAGQVVDDPPFYVSYQSAKTFCLTRKSIFNSTHYLWARPY